MIEYEAICDSCGVRIFFGVRMDKPLADERLRERIIETLGLTECSCAHVAIPGSSSTSATSRSRTLSESSGPRRLGASDAPPKGIRSRSPERRGRARFKLRRMNPVGSAVDIAVALVACPLNESPRHRLWAARSRLHRAVVAARRSRPSVPARSRHATQCVPLLGATRRSGRRHERDDSASFSASARTATVDTTQMRKRARPRLPVCLSRSDRCTGSGGFAGLSVSLLVRTATPSHFQTCAPTRSAPVQWRLKLVCR